MARGALLFLTGCFFSLYSYAQAVHSPYGGHYVIAIGAILYGAMHFVQGNAAATGRIDPHDRAQELLNFAAQLESVDRAKAVLIYNEILKKFPGTPASEEAQRNIQLLTSHP
jgi:hypothetical protein